MVAVSKVREGDCLTFCLTMQWEKAFVTFVVDNFWQFPCFVIGGIGIYKKRQ